MTHSLMACPRVPREAYSSSLYFAICLVVTFSHGSTWYKTDMDPGKKQEISEVLLKPAWFSAQELPAPVFQEIKVSKLIFALWEMGW